jgi:hypothetical protein
MQTATLQRSTHAVVRACELRARIQPCTETVVRFTTIDDHTADFSIHEPLAHVVVLRASPLGQKGLAPLLSG